MVDVRLVDLEVIKRYSLAVRRDSVPAAELLEALDASRSVVAAALAAEASARSLDGPAGASIEAPGEAVAGPGADPGPARADGAGP